MSAGEDFAALKAAGVSYKAIGAALGRNDSLIGQIARGIKPGRNLEAAAAELRRQVEANGWTKPDRLRLPEAPRRRQKVRQAVRHGGQRWSTAQAKRQATASGAHQLAGIIDDAAASGRKVALRLTVDPRAVFKQSPGRKVKGGRGRRAAQEVKLGNGGAGIDAASLVELMDATGGDVREAIAEWCVMSGHAEALPASQIWEIEVSTWD